MKEQINIEEGDILVYPVGFTLSFSEVFKDSQGLYVWDVDSKRYIYHKSEGYQWDNSLIKEMGLRKLETWMKEKFDRLYKECEHGDDEHRKWLKDKFEDFYKKEITI